MDRKAKYTHFFLVLLSIVNAAVSQASALVDKGQVPLGNTITVSLPGQAADDSGPTKVEATYFAISDNGSKAKIAELRLSGWDNVVDIPTDLPETRNSTDKQFEVDLSITGSTTPSMRVTFTRPIQDWAVAVAPSLAEVGDRDTFTVPIYKTLRVFLTNPKAIPNRGYAIVRVGRVAGYGQVRDGDLSWLGNGKTTTVTELVSNGVESQQLKVKQPEVDAVVVCIYSDKTTPTTDYGLDCRHRIVTFQSKTPVVVDGARGNTAHGAPSAVTNAGLIEQQPTWIIPATIDGTTATITGCDFPEFLFNPTYVSEATKAAVNAAGGYADVYVLRDRTWRVGDDVSGSVVQAVRKVRIGSQCINQNQSVVFDQLDPRLTGYDLLYDLDHDGKVSSGDIMAGSAGPGVIVKRSSQCPSAKLVRLTRFIAARTPGLGLSNIGDVEYTNSTVTVRLWASTSSLESGWLDPLASGGAAQLATMAKLVVNEAKRLGLSGVSAAVYGYSDSSEVRVLVLDSHFLADPIYADAIARCSISRGRVTDNESLACLRALATAALVGQVLGLPVATGHHHFDGDQGEKFRRIELRIIVRR